MKRFYFIKQKIRLIYTSPLTYLMMFLQILFLIINMCLNQYTAISLYFGLLKKEIYLWFIYIPVMVIQHKASVYSTYYNCISRICSKRIMISADYITLAISTCLSTFMVLSAPVFLGLIKGISPVSREMILTFFFLLIRYILVGLLIQYMIYTIRYAFPNLQKRGGSACVLPFLLYFVFTSPMEFLRIKGRYIPFLNFTAGEGYVFSGNSVDLWDSIIFFNIHLIGYLVLYIWITISCLSKRWEFIENESVDTL